MKPTIDLLTDIEPPQVIYGTFWQRVFASIIDGLIFIPLSILDNYNQTTFKSIQLLAIATILGLLYKPFMEGKYFATIGKMVMGLKVITSDFETPSLQHILLRNTFDIGTRVALALTAFITFLSPEFQAIDTAAGYADLSNSLTRSTWIMVAFSFLYLVDSIFMATNARKQSLHDKIGGTLVIKNKKKDFIKAQLNTKTG